MYAKRLHVDHFHQIAFPLLCQCASALPKKLEISCSRGAANNALTAVCTGTAGLRAGSPSRLATNDGPPSPRFLHQRFNLRSFRSYSRAPRNSRTELPPFPLQVPSMTRRLGIAVFPTDFPFPVSTRLNPGPRVLLQVSCGAGAVWAARSPSTGTPHGRLHPIQPKRGHHLSHRLSRWKLRQGLRQCTNSPSSPS
jgi:hypothetical protein